jgi:glycosyltransferase involved in cell wall biosynthesis
MMRILIISTYFPPHNAVASWRPYSWAKYWSEAGHDVTVLTTQKEKDLIQDHPCLIQDHPCLIQDHPWKGFHVIEVPQGKLFRFLQKQYRASSDAGDQSWIQKALHKPFGWFKALRTRTGIFHAARMPDVTDFWVWSALNALRNMPECGSEWDLVISTYGPPASHLIGCRLKKLGKVKHWIADYRDLWIGRDNLPGIFPINLFEKWLEKRLVAHADALTVVSEGMATVMKERYPNKPIHVIENGFDPTDLSSLDPKPIFPQDGKVRIVYTGVIYEKIQDLSPLFESVQQLSLDVRNSDGLQRLEMVFAGDLMGPLEQMVERWNVGPWVKLMGQLPRREALRLQRDADYLLLLGVRDKGVLFGKTFEYLFSKRPIFAIGLSHDHPLTTLIAEAQAGVVFNHEVSAIKQFLIDCLRSSERAQAETRAEVIAKYDRQQLAKRLLERITQEIKR